MYKLFVALAMLATLSACKQQETKTLHLVCKTTPSETAPSVRPQYDVTVNLLADGATLTIDGHISHAKKSNNLKPAAPNGGRFLYCGLLQTKSVRQPQV